MAKLEYFLVSESISIDQNTNRTSIFNVLEEVQPMQFPVTLPLVAAIALWRMEEGDAAQDFQVILKVVQPDGQTTEFPSNFSTDRARHRTILQLQGLPISTAGRLVFEISLNGKYVASHSVDVNEPIT